MKLRNSKTKLFCETSFKNEATKLKNEAFLRDFLQKSCFGHEQGHRRPQRGRTIFVWQVWDFEHTWSLVTLSFLLQNVETVIRVTSDQCPVTIDSFFDAVPLFDRLPMISLKLCRVFKHVSCPCFAQSGFGLESMLGEPQEQKNYFERTAKQRYIYIYTLFICQKQKR